jgi:hypothetical protein
MEAISDLAEGDSEDSTACIDRISVSVLETRD